MSPSDALTPRVGLARVGRLGILVRDGRTITATELAALVGCGLIAAAGVSLLGGQRWGLPGHAILRAALPVAIGLALVPRRFSGSMVSLFGAIGVCGFFMTGVGKLPIPTFSALCVFGPALDFVTSERFAKLHLYVRFILAGIAANACALSMKLGLVWFGDDHLDRAAWLYILSYLVFGAVAGAIAGVACFRSSGRSRAAR